jgi:hypothetical protein
MEQYLMIFLAVALALVGSFALTRPIVLIRFMHFWLGVSTKLFRSNIFTYEQTTMMELARTDAREYERKHYSHITIVRFVGLASILTVAGLLCLLFR